MPKKGKGKKKGGKGKGDKKKEPPPPVQVEEEPLSELSKEFYLIQVTKSCYIISSIHYTQYLITVLFYMLHYLPSDT